MEENRYGDSIGAAAVVFWPIVLLLFLVALTGCSHRVYVPLQSVHTDTVYKAMRDSVHVRFSPCYIRSAGSALN